MSSKKAQLEISANSAPAEEAFKRVEKAGRRMGDGVAKEGDKAGKALEGLGDEANKGAKGIDTATKSMIASVQRTTAALQAGERGSAKYFETLAQQRGVDVGTLQPYIDQLKRVEAQQVKTGVSAKQTAAALRGVPAQFTDIAVSLQGGQAPLTVFLQQGGQLKDMFGGAGEAAKALGGYVVSLVNPITVAAAAAGVLAVAYNQGSKEADSFRAALLTTGNAAGTTTNQLAGLAEQLGRGFGNTVGKAAEVLAQFAASGQVGRASLQDFAATAIMAEKAFGTATKDIAKNFADLGKDPVGASNRLNESMNYLTASTYAQIRAAVDLGQTSKAAALAQDAYNAALKGTSSEMLASMGYIEKAWGGVKSAAKEAWDAMLGIGRPAAVSSEIESVQARLDAAIKSRQGLSANYSLSATLDKEISKLKEEITNLNEINRLQKRAGDSAAERVAKEQAGIQAQKDGLKYLSQEQKMRNDIAQQTATMRKAGMDEAAIQERIAQIKASYAKKDGKAKEIAEYDKLNQRIGDFAALQTAALAADGKLSEGQRLAVRIKQDMIAAGDKLSATEKQRLQTNLDAALAIEQRLGAEKDLAKFMAESQQIQAKAVDQSDKATEALTKQAAAEREAAASVGLTKDAIAQLTAAKYDDSAASKERLADTMAEAGEPELLVKKYRAEAAALRDLAAAKRERGAAEASSEAEKIAKQAADRAAAEWQRAADKIEGSITEALMRGFESGKGFAQTLKDTVVNMFKTMVLRPVIQMAVGGVTGMGGSSAMAGSGGGGGMGGFGGIGQLAGLGGAFGSHAATGFMHSMTTFGHGFGMQAGQGMMAAGNTAGGMGMMAGTGAAYLGGAYVGVQAGRAIGGGYSTNGGSGNSAVNVGTAIGMAMGGPLGAIIGGIAGGTFNRAFGRKLTESGIEGQFGPGGFTGQSYTFEKGGLFRSDRTRRSTLDAGTDKLLDDAYAGIFSSVKEMGSALGLGSAVLDKFTFDLKLNLKGLTEAQVNEKLAEQFSLLNEAMAKQVLGTEDYTRQGETAAQALQRLGTSLTGVNAVLGTLSQSLLATSLNGADAASQLADLFGGLDKFAQATEAYYQAFYSEAERNAKATEQLTTELKGLGMSMPDTLAGFRALVDAQDLTTEAGRKTYAALISLSPAFAQVSNAAGELAAKLGKSVATAINSTLTEVERQITASQSAADAAREAADAYRSAGQTLQDAATAILLGVGNVAQNTTREYQRVLALARGGDTAAMGALPGAATAMLSEGRNTAATRVQAMLQAAQTAADLAGVGNSATAFAGQKDYQARLFDVNTAVLEVLRTDLQTGNITIDLLKQHLVALNGIGAMTEASKDVTFEGLKAVEGETGTVADITELVAKATGANEALSLAILSQLQVPDAGSNFLSQTIQTGNEFLAGRLEGVIAAINKQSEANQQEIARQNNLTAAQSELQITKEKQSLAVGQVRSASQAIFDLAGSYGVFLNDVAGPVTMANTAKFNVNEQGLFEAAYGQISYGKRSGADAFLSDFQRAGGLYDQTFGRSGELQGLAQELERQRQAIRNLGGVPAFASGGAFANGIVTRPTAFAMGQMGEAGPEAIMPLSNVGGSLGVRAQMPGTQDMLQALQAMQALMQRMQVASENGALTSQEHFDLMRRMTRDGRGMPVVPSPNDPLTVEIAA
jgi:phage-related minor tail protein